MCCYWYPYASCVHCYWYTYASCVHCCCCWYPYASCVHCCWHSYATYGSYFMATTTSNPISIGPQVTNSSASSSGQIVVGSHVVNLSVSTPSVTSPQSSANNPFTLKLKTNLIKICQACRKGFNGTNDTLGLVFARPERRIVSNVATGVSFLGRESNSHYHLHMMCIRKADPSFKPTDLVSPMTLKNQLSVCQKLYLSRCFQLSV